MAHRDLARAISELCSNPSKRNRIAEGIYKNHVIVSRRPSNLQLQGKSSSTDESPPLSREIAHLHAPPYGVRTAQVSSLLAMTGNKYEIRHYLHATCLVSTGSHPRGSSPHLALSGYAGGHCHRSRKCCAPGIERFANL